MELTFDHAKELLEEIVSEKPVGYDYVTDPKTIERRNTVDVDKTSNGCYYAHADGAPGCIIGQLIHKLNPEFDLDSIETASTGHALQRAGIFSAEAGVVKYLAVVQSFQDGGKPWRDAVDAANSKWDVI